VAKLQVLEILAQRNGSRVPTLAPTFFQILEKCKWDFVLNINIHQLEICFNKCFWFLPHLFKYLKFIRVVYKEIYTFYIILFHYFVDRSF